MERHHEDENGYLVCLSWTHDLKASYQHKSITSTFIRQALSAEHRSIRDSSGTRVKHPSAVTTLRALQAPNYDGAVGSTSSSNQRGLLNAVPVLVFYRVLPVRQSCSAVEQHSFRLTKQQDSDLVKFVGLMLTSLAQTMVQPSRIQLYAFF